MNPGAPLPSARRSGAAPRLLVAVINHGLADRALELKERLGRHAETVAIDSGSRLTLWERLGFDLCLPNVYYGGCARAAARLARERGATHVWIWASDVDCDEIELALLLGRETFEQTGAGVYAPSGHYSFHRQMRPRPRLGLARVSFTDGFCVATRTDYLERTCEDFTGCRYGFGLEIHMAMLSRRDGRPVYVDHRYRVRHPQGAGYSVDAATREWYAWRDRQPLATRLFHRLARKRVFKTPVGMRVLLALPWRRLARRLPPPARAPAFDHAPFARR